LLALELGILTGRRETEWNPNAAKKMNIASAEVLVAVNGPFFEITHTGPYEHSLSAGVLASVGSRLILGDS